MTQFRPTKAVVDLSAIRSNVEELKRVSGTEVACVVKANGYGHGAVEVSRACLEAGATRLCVALVEEGVQLREAQIEAPIVVLIEAPEDASEAIIEHGLTASVSRIEAAESLATAAKKLDRIATVHLCVDTGMHREGVDLAKAPELAQQIGELESLHLEGIWSHFAVADEPRNPIIEAQIDRFTALQQDTQTDLQHLANSAGSLVVDSSRLSFVRAGISTYGLYPAAELSSVANLTPAMSLVSAVGLTRRIERAERVSYGLTWQAKRDTNIATVQIGYADGYPRVLSNNADVLIGGKRRPVIGRVTMDTIIVDLGDDQTHVGEEAVLIGSQGEESITAEELAARALTINYEIVCGVSQRVPRVYV